MSTLDKIIFLLDKNNLKQQDLMDYLNLEKSTFSGWKSGKTTSYKKHISEIANFFNVSTDYLLNDEVDSIPSNIEPLPNEKVHMIPIYENVSAGFGAYACSDVVEYIPLFINNSADADDTLCIKVTGDSMCPKIENGDIIVVRKQSSVDSGQIAVVLIDSVEGKEGVVKKVTYGKNWIELISFNPIYPPLHFEGVDILKLSIVGLVKQIIKNV